MKQQIDPDAIQSQFEQLSGFMSNFAMIVADYYKDLKGQGIADIHAIEMAQSLQDVWMGHILESSLK